MGKRKSVSAVWAREVQKAMAVEPPPTTRSRFEIESEIAIITKALIGPLPSVVRLDYVEARAALRKQLAALAE